MIKLSTVNKLRYTTDWLQKKWSSRAVILMYHRVTEATLDPWSLSVTPHKFAEHLEVIKKYTHPISLKELVKIYQDGKIPDRAVAITFDDGYANNLHIAKPLLEQYDIPATVFITTGYIEKNREYWWDELDRVLMQPGRLPENLSLCINGGLRKWKLGKAVDYSEDDYQRDHNRQEKKSYTSPRLSLYYSIWEQLHSLPNEQLQKALDEILDWADAAPTVRPTLRPLVKEEIHTLVKEGLVDVEAHTVTHSVLPALSAVLQSNEIQQSKKYLEEVLGHSVNGFSYPFGNYTKETISLVREAGFSYACSVAEGTVWRRSDCFKLPRFQVKDWNGEKFEQWLLSYFKS